MISFLALLTHLVNHGPLLHMLHCIYQCISKGLNSYRFTLIRSILIGMLISILKFINLHLLFLWKNLPLPSGAGGTKSPISPTKFWTRLFTPSLFVKKVSIFSYIQIQCKTNIPCPKIFNALKWLIWFEFMNLWVIWSRRIWILNLSSLNLITT